jgi:hypothetical protein
VDFEEALLRCCGADRRDKEEELQAVICFFFTDVRLRWGELPQLYFRCAARLVVMIHDHRLHEILVARGS